ncbi:MAG: hypothetical protein EPN38_00735 [Rhodanobacteraceae bacterium]|nr:MAG: hypothetical protein EPN38_00735 [Rhodanobacteraceae bacterium]
MHTFHNPPARPPDAAAVAARAQAIFSTACDNVDSYHARRLDLARQHAVRGYAPHPTLRMWAPLAGAAACCVLVAGILWTRPAPRAHGTAAPRITAAVPQTAATPADDAAAVDVGSGQAEMMQNLDFYRWLAAQPAVAVAPGTGGH